MRFYALLPVLVAGGTSATPLPVASSGVQLFNFSSYIDIENSYLRSETQLLLTTFDDGRMYQINPLAENPQAELILKAPGATALNGVVRIGADKFAFSGGVRGNFMYTNETLYTVDFGHTNSSGAPTVAIAATLPDAVFLNGISALPASPHVVLLADSNLGCLWRVDTTTGAVDKVITDPAFAIPANVTTRIGINGLKIREGYAYFTNTGAGVFGRIPITETGERAGDVEIIRSAAAGISWDDFEIAADGNAYIAQGPGAVLRVTPDGQASFAVGSANSTALIGPTSISIPRPGKAYVTTRGGVVGSGTYQYSGQVFEISI
ncbi:hypothetical protein GGR51DRAFT_508720 [Nemania sp. FL0031]|nr:hypothetical protein GGR51DRAFT_508720 [Nemania sp. FL0031]